MEKIKHLLLIALFLSSSLLHAQTTLSPGDIAFVQVNNTEDSFDFILLKSIVAGTQIKFTDQSYVSGQGLVNTFLLPTDAPTSTKPDWEIIATFTAPTDLAAGVIIQSDNNVNFDNSDFDFFNHDYGNDGSAYLGETLIAFQEDEGTNTYLSAIGWMSNRNFPLGKGEGLYEENGNGGTSDIPPGLSKEDNTVVQLDSLTSSHSQIFQRDFKYLTNYGTEGSAYYLRTLFANPDHFVTYQSATVVSGPFTVLPDDNNPPVLTKSEPADNAIGVSILSDFSFSFDETVNIKKDCDLTNFTTSGLVKHFNVNEITLLNNKAVFLSFDGLLVSNTVYLLKIPSGFVMDNDGNEWPSQATYFKFTTQSVQNKVMLSFNNADIENQTWHRISDETSIDYADVTQHNEYGYFTFSEKNIDCRLYKRYYYADGESWIDSDMIDGSLNMYSSGEKSVLDLQPINDQITYIKSRVMANNTPLTVSIYSGGAVVKSQSINDSFSSSLQEVNGETYVNLAFSFDNSETVDSIVFESLEGAVLQLDIEFEDLSIPTVTLGVDKSACYGDSVEIGSSRAFGESIVWNTGDTSERIWATTSGTYTMTVTNSLGSASDEVEITILPELVKPFNDEKRNLCYGEKTMIVAGPESLLYIWEDLPGMTENLHQREISEAGTYIVTISNGLCYIKDTIEIIMQGSQLDVYTYEGGMWAYDDTEAYLYKKNADGFYDIYKKELMQGNYISYNNLPSGEYVFKMHFVQYSFVGENPFLDTYHDGSTDWENIEPITVTCPNYSGIGFNTYQHPQQAFNGTSSISGNVETLILKSASDAPTDIVNIKLLKDNILIASHGCNGNDQFTFDNLPAGNYALIAECTGYTTSTPYTFTLTGSEVITEPKFMIRPSSHSITRSFATGLNPNFDKNISVYPNPATDIIYVNGSSKASFRLINLSGRTVKSFDSNSNGSLNISDIKSGIYLLQILDKNTIITKPILIQ